MVWVLWRQHRAQGLAVAGLLLLLGLYMLVAGRDAAFVLSWLPIVPLMVGVFWGAPLLARELEKGTHRLAWTQSVTRQRWLVSKLGVLGLAVLVAALVLGVMVNSWVTEFDADRFGDAAIFSGTGVVVGSWWLFAFLLGAASGGLLRRLLPALGATVAVFVLVLIVMIKLREGYAEPVRSVQDAIPAGAVAADAAWVSKSGTEVDVPPVCTKVDPAIYLSCVREAGYRFVVYFHPADRYWRFQWTETGILLLGTVLLAGPVVYRVLRRPV